ERRQLALECLPARPHAQVDVLPIIQARALHLAFVEGKAERFDEVQRGPGGETAAAGVTGVPVDLGMNENDVKAHALCGMRVVRSPDRRRVASRDRTGTSAPHRRTSP